MFQHHLDSIENVTKKLRDREEVQAVIVCGSIAHGFASADSDVDLMILVPELEYLDRTERGDLQYFERDSCTYDRGYIDGKYISPAFLREAAVKGSEPARFAFEGAWASYSQMPELDLQLKAIARYPVENKLANIPRFYGQFETWKWYCEEALRLDNRYLLQHSVANLILFAGRLFLAHNETLYPYHKWFLRVLETVSDKPSGLMRSIHGLLENPNREGIQQFYEMIKDYRQWELNGVNWPSMFMRDCELKWVDGEVPVAEL